MKTFLLISILSISNMAIAQDVIEKFVGCYKTITLNGKPVVSDDPIQTEITHEYSPYIDAETRASIPAIKFFIYQGKFSDGHHMQLSYLPTDRGNTLDDKNEIHYVYDGKIRFKTKPEAVFTMHIKVDFKIISDKFLDITIFNKFDEAGNGATTNFVLEKTECSSEE